jgi:hypothetical protein
MISISKNRITPREILFIFKHSEGKVIALERKNERLTGVIGKNGRLYLFKQDGAIYNLHYNLRSIKTISLGKANEEKILKLLKIKRIFIQDIDFLQSYYLTF